MKVFYPYVSEYDDLSLAMDDKNVEIEIVRQPPGPGYKYKIRRKGQSPRLWREEKHASTLIAARFRARRMVKEIEKRERRRRKAGVVETYRPKASAEVAEATPPRGTLLDWFKR